MKVNAIQNPAQSPLYSAASREKFQADFQATLDAASQNLTKASEHKRALAPKTDTADAEELAE